MKKLLLRIVYRAIMALTLSMPAAAIAQVNTDQVIRVGQNALYFEDYVLSIQYFNQAILAKPHLAQPYLLRAIAKINLDDYAGAEADASKAIDLNPFLPDAWEVRGVARQNLGRNLSAVQDYNEALKLLPRNRQIMFNKAMAQSDIKDYAGADSTFTDLLKYYPGFDNAYVGRAKLKLAMSDTTAAAADIDKALQINKNALNAYILRADISINTHKDLARALQDMNEAVRLEPRLAGLYINRAFLRYSLDDYFGAMADYDYALQLDPLNQVALFNRGLMLTEVGDNDRALIDFTTILQLDPDDYRSLYNRAVINGQKHNFTDAIADIDKVIQRFPDFSSAYYLRSDFHRQRGDMRSAQADYKKALALAKAARPASQQNTDATATTTSPEGDEVPPELVAKRFNTLLTIDNDTHIDQEYNNSAIRGRVQDHDLAIELEPIMELSYYSSPTELRTNTYYIKEVADINAARMLRYVIVVTSRPPNLDTDQIANHFSSVEYYNSYLSTHTPRTIDYLGRAMDFITLKNYPAAIADLNHAAELTPDNPVVFFLRAQARYHDYFSQPVANPEAKVPGQPEKAAALAATLQDLDRTIELSPRMAMAWFNKGNILYQMGDLTSAIAAFTRAIEFEPAMGEAFYNRGFIYLKLGNRDLGIADLSKAGEHGIVAAYNLLKRISKSL